jgi:hypothetical protein
MGDGHLWIAGDTQSLNVKTKLEGAGELLEGGAGDGDEIRGIGVRILLPAEGLVDACEDVVATGIGMDFVVETVDDEMVLVDIRELFFVDGVPSPNRRNLSGSRKQPNLCANDPSHGRSFV